MTIQTIKTADDELIVIRRQEFEELMEKAGVIPAWPRADDQGATPAHETIDISIARDMITGRIRRGWTQKELARRAGVRLETVCRIEAGKHIARRETLLKLDRALASA